MSLLGNLSKGVEREFAMYGMKMAEKRGDGRGLLKCRYGGSRGVGIDLAADIFRSYEDEENAEGEAAANGEIDETMIIVSSLAWIQDPEMHSVGTGCID